ncbi:unnamed protein product [Anisakis simplex]|uniref:Neuropeptide F n=1 Tax=Anisakis simplex TaxID=6269 RepID=A0A0M3J9W6_ANISI|nr:unnamed protein product [Anisakis simplex]
MVPQAAVLVCFSTLLFTPVLSLPLYSYEDLSSPSFGLYRDEGFLPVLEPSEYDMAPRYDPRAKRSFYGLFKKLDEAYKHRGLKKAYQ